MTSQGAFELEIIFFDIFETVWLSEFLATLFRVIAGSKKFKRNKY